MAVVKINAVTIPEGRGDEFEQRFADRAGLVDGVPGFLGFQLLRPTDEGGRWFVLSRWESEDAFHGWMSSEDFRKAHERVPGREPVGTHNELLSFEVVELATGREAARTAAAAS